MKKQKIKVIIFDVGGVLALPIKNLFRKSRKQIENRNVHNYISQKLNISLDDYFDSIDATYVKSMSGEISKNQTIKIISKNLKISPKKLINLYKKAYLKKFKQNKQLFKQAFKFKKQGYKIAILSDQWHLSKDVIMPKKLYKIFDEIIVSCEVGMRKPDIKIYKLIIKKLKIRSEQTVFIDNREWNLEPAQKLKMKTILFKDNKQLFKQLEKLGVK